MTTREKVKAATGMGIKEAILWYAKEIGLSKERAAKEMGISKKTLLKEMKRLKVGDPFRPQTQRVPECLPGQKSGPRPYMRAPLQIGGIWYHNSEPAHKCEWERRMK